jgi:hypothetical protein
MWYARVMGSNPKALLKYRPWRTRPRWVLVHGTVITLVLAGLAWLRSRRGTKLETKPLQRAHLLGNK